MRRYFLKLLLYPLLICSVLFAGQSGPKLSKDSLTVDEIAIYRELIRHFLNSSDRYPQINLANKTIPFNWEVFFGRTCSRKELDKKAASLNTDEEFHVLLCVGLDISDINFPKADKNTVPIIHKFDSSVVSGLNASLVDPDKQRNKVESIPRFPPCMFSSDPEQRSGENCERQLKKLLDLHYQAALLTVSEILFDEQHLHVGVSFEFDCGVLCGERGSALLKKVDGKWVLLREVTPERS